MERNFTESEIIQYGEIQYLRGRLDELHKAIKTITNIDRSRKIDARIGKYLNKLYEVDHVSYLQYECEISSRNRVTEKKLVDM